MTAPTRVEFFFDAMCPYAYQTSLWARDVRRQAGIEVSWRFFSLEEVNREPRQKHPWERDWSWGWSMMRTAAWLRRQDMALCDRWYAACGKALHEDGRKPFVREVAEQVAAEAGLPAGAVEAANSDPSTHDDIRADHEWLLENHAGYGVPTLYFPEYDHALFGPVVVPAPTGDEAMRLWDLTTGWLEFPHLYELCKPKTAADHGHIGTAFLPYLEARTWVTIQRPVA